MVPVLALGGRAGQTANRFSPEERARLVAYWAEPNRYRVGLPADIRDKGLYQVRLTPSGSEWIWKYNRARRASAPPTQDAPALTSEQQDWEKWISAKVAWDRWQAGETARNLNRDLLARELPRGDKTIPDTQPAQPGVIPEALFALAGSPPPFATVVTPMEHVVTLQSEPLRLRDHFRPGNPRYAYYRFHEGVGDDGTSIKDLKPEKLQSLLTMAGVDDSQARILRAVSALEGGFDAINTYDTGYVSIGFIQFASLSAGAGSLGRMLLGYRTEQPDAFYEDFRRFGLDVSDDGRLIAVDPTTGAELIGPEANSAIIADKRLVAIFQRAGRESDRFNAFQIKAALKEYWPGEDALTFNIDGITVSARVSEVIKSEAGLATLLDRKVNTGKIDPMAAVCERVAQENACRSLDDLAKLEKEILVRMKYRKDYLADKTLSQPGGPRVASLASRGGGRGLRAGGSAAPVAASPVAASAKVVTTPTAAKVRTDEKAKREPNPEQIVKVKVSPKSPPVTAHVDIVMKSAPAVSVGTSAKQAKKKPSRTDRPVEGRASKKGTKNFSEDKKGASSRKADQITDETGKKRATRKRKNSVLEEKTKAVTESPKAEKAVTRKKRTVRSDR